ncbi:MAG: aminoacyl-tRNA hydrolase [Coriobacteriia bacterium]|nr:aminoacyl-tRNA hydrolase [Coriobacteriia bacterium]
MARMVIGLGNPGAEYDTTRHNAGFMVIDLLAENLRVSYWKDEAGAKVGLVRFGEDDLVIVKPQTFMNLSGKAVAKLAHAYEVDVADIIIVHDDLDLPEETVRVKRGGGHGGHNGLRSLADALGSGDFLRVRLGIGRPPGRQAPADFVLEPMRRDVAERLAEMVPHAAQAVLHILEYGVDSAMQEYNAG